MIGRALNTRALPQGDHSHNLALHLCGNNEDVSAQNRNLLRILASPTITIKAFTALGPNLSYHKSAPPQACEWRPGDDGEDRVRPRVQLLLSLPEFWSISGPVRVSGAMRCVAVKPAAATPPRLRHHRSQEPGDVLLLCGGRPGQKSKAGDGKKEKPPGEGR